MINFVCDKKTELYIKPIVELLKSDEFFEASENITNFDPLYTSPKNITGKDILRTIRFYNYEIIVSLYTQKWIAYKFCPVNAYVNREGNIFINTRNLSRNFKDIQETIWHELVHVSNKFNVAYRYNHGDNNPKGKENTAPVKFSKWAVGYWIDNQTRIQNKL